MEKHVMGHCEVVRGFGRFPKRNETLGRESTENEIRYINNTETLNRPY